MKLFSRFRSWLGTLNKEPDARPVPSVRPEPYRFYTCKALIVLDGTMYVVKTALLVVTGAGTGTMQFAFHDATVLKGVEPQPHDRLLYVESVDGLASGKYKYRPDQFGGINAIVDFNAIVKGPVLFTHKWCQVPEHTTSEGSQIYGFHKTKDAQASTLFRDKEEVLNHEHSYSNWSVDDSNDYMVDDDKFVEMRLILE